MEVVEIDELPSECFQDHKLINTVGLLKTFVAYNPNEIGKQLNKNIQHIVPLTHGNNFLN